MTASSTESAESKMGSWLWGGLPKEDVFRYQLLSAVMFFTLTGYWIVRATKMGVFVAVVGLEV
jgi:hypothetical protein